MKKGAHVRRLFSWPDDHAERRRDEDDASGQHWVAPSIAFGRAQLAQTAQHHHPEIAVTVDDGNLPHLCHVEIGSCDGCRDVWQFVCETTWAGCGRCFSRGHLFA